jgi:hypothetical protein
LAKELNVNSITENHVVSALAAVRRLLPLVSASATLFIAVMGTLNSRLQEVQVPTAGTVPSLLSTRSLRFFIRLKSAAVQLFISKKDNVSPCWTLRLNGAKEESFE